jgi:hypothetical protein
VVEDTVSKEEFDALKKQVAELTGSINELVGAWKAAGLMVALTKWAAGVITAILGAWIAFAKFREMS